MSVSSINDSFIRRSINIGILVTSLGTFFSLIGFFAIEGFFLSLDERIKKFSGDICIYKQGLEGDELFDDKISEDICNKMDVENLSFRKTIHMPCVLTYKTQRHGILVLGSSNTDFINQYIIEGSSSNLNNKNQIAISHFWKKKLNVTLGNYIGIQTFSNIPKYKKMQVCAIYKTELPDFDERFVIANLENSYALSSTYRNLVDSIRINLKNSTQIQNTIESIENILPQNFLIKTYKTDLSDIYEWIEVLQQNVYLFMVVLLIVILNTILAICTVLFIYKLYTIDLLKILGVQSNTIAFVFLQFVIKIVLNGLVIGNILTLVLMFIIKYVLRIKLDSSVHYVSHLPISFSYNFFIIVNCSILIISLFAWIISTLFIHYMKIDASKYR